MDRAKAMYGSTKDNMASRYSLMGAGVSDPKCMPDEATMYEDGKCGPNNVAKMTIANTHNIRQINTNVSWAVGILYLLAIPSIIMASVNTANYNKKTSKINDNVFSVLEANAAHQTREFAQAVVSQAGDPDKVDMRKFLDEAPNMYKKFFRDECYASGEAATALTAKHMPAGGNPFDALLGMHAFHTVPTKCIEELYQVCEENDENNERYRNVCRVSLESTVQEFHDDFEDDSDKKLGEATEKATKENKHCWHNMCEYDVPDGAIGVSAARSDFKDFAYCTYTVGSKTRRLYATDKCLAPVQVESTHVWEASGGGTPDTVGYTMTMEGTSTVYGCTCYEYQAYDAQCTKYEDDENAKADGLYGIDCEDVAIA